MRIKVWENYYLAYKNELADYNERLADSHRSGLSLLRAPPYYREPLDTNAMYWYKALCREFCRDTGISENLSDRIRPRDVIAYYKSNSGAKVELWEVMDSSDNVLAWGLDWQDDCSQLSWVRENWSI